jgi:hypothetical protein
MDLSRIFLLRVRASMRLDTLRRQPARPAWTANQAIFCMIDSSFFA